MRRKRFWDQWPLSGWLALAGGLLFAGSWGAAYLCSLLRRLDDSRMYLLMGLTAVGLVALLMSGGVFLIEQRRQDWARYLLCVVAVVAGMVLMVLAANRP